MLASMQIQEKKQAAADVLFQYSKFVMACIGNQARPSDMRLHLMKVRMPYLNSSFQFGIFFLYTNDAYIDLNDFLFCLSGDFWNANFFEERIIPHRSFT